MRILRGKIYAMRIPFVETFAHSTADRKFSDSIIVRLDADDETAGFGEGVARPYVTGETIESCIEYIRNCLFPIIETIDFDEAQPENDPLETLAPISGKLPGGTLSGGVIPNAARAAVEIALVDCSLRRQRLSLGELLPPKRDSVTYSGVITAGTIENAIRHAKRFKLFGIDQLKVKIGSSDDEARVSAIRNAVGDRTSIRLDANGAFNVPQAIEVSRKLSKFRIDALEQPIAQGRPQDLAEVRASSEIPVMADESLVTVDDAEELIRFSACDFFNLRVSKCGGISNTIRLANLAKKAGIRLQLGCQVGETAILSAVGRHIAAYLDDVEFVEGSFGNLLLIKDVGHDSIHFGHGGKAPLLRGMGIGVDINENILHKYAYSIAELG